MDRRSESRVQCLGPPESVPGSGWQISRSWRTGRKFRPQHLLVIWHTNVHLKAATRQCPPKVPIGGGAVGTAWRLWLAGGLGQQRRFLPGDHSQHPVRRKLFPNVSPFRGHPKFQNISEQPLPTLYPSHSFLWPPPQSHSRTAMTAAACSAARSSFPACSLTAKYSES